LESDVEIRFCDFPEANRLILHIISSIAEYEANLISIRTRQSLQAKKSRGYHLGKSENLKPMILSKGLTNSGIYGVKVYSLSKYVSKTLPISKVLSDYQFSGIFNQ
jgi:hypothetical protein